MVPSSFTLVAGSLLALSSACVKFPPFVCDRDQQCMSAEGEGTCEASGACSFRDALCDSGRRFGESAGELAGSCVAADDGDDGDGDGIDAGIDDGGVADAGGDRDAGDDVCAGEHCPPPVNAGDSCAAAPYLPLGVLVAGQTTTPLTDDYGNAEWNGCIQNSLDFSPGRDGVYRLSLPADQQLKVTVQAYTDQPCYEWPFQPSLFVFTDCADVGGSCLHGATGADIYQTDLWYTNTTGAPLDLFLAIDTTNPFGLAGHGCYSIQADAL